VIPFLAQNKKPIYKEIDTRGQLNTLPKIFQGLKEGYEIGIPHNDFLVVDIDAHK